MVLMFSRPARRLMLKGRYFRKWNHDDRFV